MVPPFSYLQRSDKNQLPQDTIHIFTSVNGWRSIRQFLVSMKSLLYYQNRIIPDQARCTISFPNATILPCPRHSKKRQNRSMQLHILSFHPTRRILNDILTKWNLRYLNWEFYSMEDYQVSPRVFVYHFMLRRGINLIRQLTSAVCFAYQVLWFQ